MLTVHLHLPPKLRMSGGMCLLPLHAFMMLTGTIYWWHCLPSRVTSGFVFLNNVSIILPNNHGILVFHYTLHHVPAVRGRIINSSPCSLFEWCSLRKRGLIWVRGHFWRCWRELLKEILRSARTVHLRMSFVWICEQTAFYSLYSVNWWVLITQTECVYCAVRAECVNTVHLLHLPTLYPVSTLPQSQERAGTAWDLRAVYFSV